jgi:hypothetical protein
MAHLFLKGAHMLNLFSFFSRTKSQTVAKTEEPINGYTHLNNGYTYFGDDTTQSVQKVAAPAISASANNTQTTLTYAVSTLTNIPSHIFQYGAGFKNWLFPEKQTQEKTQAAQKKSEDTETLAHVESLSEKKGNPLESASASEKPAQPKTGSSVPQGLVYLDTFLDLVPFGSAASNIVNLTLKQYVIKDMDPENSSFKAYIEHVQKKNTQECLVYSIPFAGNLCKLGVLASGLWPAAKKTESKKNEEAIDPKKESLLSADHLAPALPPAFEGTSRKSSTGDEFSLVAGLSAERA